MFQVFQIKSKKNEEIQISGIKEWKELQSILEFKIASEDGGYRYQINIQTPQQTINFKSENCILFIQPENELLKLSEKINKFINHETIKRIIFIPSESNFELILEKIEDNTAKLCFWFDNGNYLGSKFYSTWDSIGIRFICDFVELKKFSEDIGSFAMNLLK